MLKFILLAVCLLVLRGAAAGDNLYSHLTPEDQRRIERLPEEKRELVTELTDYIRSEAERVGVDPAVALGDAPNGVDDREYRRRRLEALQAKRERKAEEVRRMHERQERRLQETGRIEEVITAKEASSMFAGRLPVAQKKLTEAASDESTLFFEAPAAEDEAADVFSDSGAHEDELRYPGNIDLRRIFEEEKQQRRMHEADDAWMPKKPSDRLGGQPISLRVDKHVWSDIASTKPSEGIVRVSSEKVLEANLAESLRKIEKTAEDTSQSESFSAIKQKAEEGAARFRTELKGQLKRNTELGSETSDSPSIDRRCIFFISESMGKVRLEELFKAYAGDDSVHFVLRGFRGNGTINEGLKAILELAQGVEAVPNIEINPQLFRRYGIDRAPAMLIEEAKPAEKPESDIFRSMVSEDLYSIYAEQFGVSAAERIRRETSRRTPQKQFEPRLLVYGVVSRDWAERKIEEGSDFDQGTRGAVYEIIEPDLEEVMKQRALAVDWEAKKEAALKRYWVNASMRYVKLERAERDEVRTVDPSFTAPQSIFDAAGIEIIRAGTRINPLDNLPFTQEMIVFNAADADQLPAVDALVSKAAGENRRIKLIATEIETVKGWEAFDALVERWNRPIYLLTPELKERFDLRRVPATVTASKEKGRLLVREFAVGSD